MLGWLLRWVCRCFRRPSTLPLLDMEGRTDAELSPGDAVKDEDFITLSPPEGAAPESGKLKAYVVLPDPKLALIPGFIRDDEIAHLLQLAEEAQAWVPSVVWRGGDASQRKSDSFMLQSAQTPVVESIEQRAAAVAGVPVGQVERLNIVRYKPGQFYGAHHDGRNRPKTVFIYLNDVDAGGETRFPKLGVQVKPLKGCAVFWSNLHEDGSMDWRTTHQGMPPKSGYKYAVNAFICKVSRGAANEWPGHENTGYTMDPWWARSSVGVREIRELSLRKLAEHHLSPADMAVVLGTADASAAVEERAMSIIEVMAQPWIGVMPGFLEPDEVQYIRAACMKRPQGWTVPHADEEQGTSSCLPLAAISQEYADILAERLADALDVELKRVEPLVVERYLPGEFTCARHAGAKRSHSVLVYLDEVPAGSEDGITDFKHATLQVRPDLAGSALAWRNRLTDSSAADTRLLHTETPLSGMSRFHVMCHILAE